MTTLNLFEVQSGYPQSPTLDNYPQNRPTDFMPLADNGMVLVPNSTSISGKSRQGTTVELWTDDVSVDHERPRGVWVSTNRESAFQLWVNIRKEHHYAAYLGHMDTTSTKDSIMKHQLSPIVNFSGIAFKWNTFESYGGKSGISIKHTDHVAPYRGIFLTCFDTFTGKITFQRMEPAGRVGYDIEEVYIPYHDVTNIAYYALSADDQAWVRSGRIYLIGVGIQLYSLDYGPFSANRRMSLWDMQVLYQDQTPNHVMFDNTDNGIGNHSNYYSAPSKIYTH